MPSADDEDPPQPITAASSTSTTDTFIKILTELVHSVGGIQTHLAARDDQFSYGLLGIGSTTSFPTNLPGSITSAPLLPSIPGIGSAAPILPSTIPTLVHQIQFPHSPSSIPSIRLSSAGLSMGGIYNSPPYSVA
ncbi:hypothetical protein GUJ93_ZPchr0005g14855 [Zizania palustris]|uniref:Uncharacterized protein n=1 Tax=Zizania palustris TaxID=103762 RepID=A0A8J5SY27_ZIZPA|nr:hypothetical protein GUJ93_ZPchr0005g14855 [Zizania palustris]